ncbi:MAG: hypothetical protein P0S93_00095 [Candidatus Neptunochlamydia sp.]|nr:hypothetical protein [Candidatus Neptunochlamydia sp.]
MCSEVMDGETNGLFSISKRCFHVFRETCIKKWVGEHDNTCPCCKLKNFSVVEITLNPDFVVQYKAWKGNPEKHSFEEAMEDLYCGKFLFDLIEN